MATLIDFKLFISSSGTLFTHKTSSKSDNALFLQRQSIEIPYNHPSGSFLYRHVSLMVIKQQSKGMFAVCNLLCSYDLRTTDTNDNEVYLPTQETAFNVLIGLILSGARNNCMQQQQTQIFYYSCCFQNAHSSWNKFLMFYSACFLENVIWRIQVFLEWHDFHPLKIIVADSYL